MKFSQKGQAFSTFQLLIAAIVAVLILAFILPIFSKLMIPGDAYNTVGVAANGVEQMKGSPGQHFLSKTEVYFKKGDFLNSTMIADRSDVGMSPDQICISAGEFSDNWKPCADTEGTCVQNSTNYD